MAQRIVQVNAKLLVSPEEFERQNGSDGARFFAGVPGLLWKIWLINRETGEAGGIKLFADETICAEYINGPIMAQLAEYPLWTDFSYRVFDYLPAQSAITRAPVGEQALVPAGGENGTPMTFNSMAVAAYQTVPTIKPVEAWRRVQDEPDLLVIDVQDAADVAAAGTVAGAVNISYGSLTYKADLTLPEEWRAPQFTDRGQPIITTCGMGPFGAIGGKLLHDMGYSNVQILDGGVQAWIEAGLPVSRNGAS